MADGERGDDPQEPPPAATEQQQAEQEKQVVGPDPDVVRARRDEGFEHRQREALGWSLFGFNFGVELGQLAVVVPLAFVLGTLWRTRPKLARQVATAGSIVVIAGGGYWFLQRTVFAT